MIKKCSAVGLALVLLLAVAVVTGCGSGLAGDAAAKVGSATISQKAFEDRVSEIEIQYRGQVPTKDQAAEYKKFQSQVLDYLVTLEIVRQKQAELKVSVTDAEVQKEIDAIKTSLGGEEKFNEALKSQGLTLAQVKRDQKDADLLKKASEAVTKNVKVTDAEISAYFDAHKSDFYQAETRKARHILITPGDASSDDTSKATEAQWAAAKAEAEKVRNEIKNGADFGAEAKKYSDDTGTKELGGDLGTVQRGTMVTEFDDALFNLKKDEISQPIKTVYGYHIIQVQEITAAKQKTLEESKESIRATLLSEKQKEAWNAWLEKSKKELDVVYKEGFAPTTTTTAKASGSSTTEKSSTSSTKASTATTAKE